MLCCVVVLLCPPAGSAVFFAHSTVIYNYEKAYLPAWLAKSWPWWALKVFLTKQVRKGGAQQGTAQHGMAWRSSATRNAAVGCCPAGEGMTCVC
jgi:hypothetical protein